MIASSHCSADNNVRQWVHYGKPGNIKTCMNQVSRDLSTASQQQLTQISIR